MRIHPKRIAFIIVLAATAAASRGNAIAQQPTTLNFINARLA